MVDSITEEVTLRSAGRITMPVGVRDVMGISKGDRVMVEYKDIDETHLPRVGSAGRITIPKDMRRDHNLSKGEELEVEFRDIQ